ncbi:transmembrane protein, putative [Medicago truncatula]|uniref:Transmembrane protein, putative n=1 Tax=Medicago truncatula TaxID=3880 RepID=G7JAS9_MEDTR|nr:transmembrane protein, putative [Medicago truncatula]
MGRKTEKTYNEELVLENERNNLGKDREEAILRITVALHKTSVVGFSRYRISEVLIGSVLSVQPVRGSVLNSSASFLRWLLMVHDWLSADLSKRDLRWFSLKGGGSKKDSVAAFRGHIMGSWSVNLSVLAVGSYTMTEKMGLVLFRSISGLIIMLTALYCTCSSKIMVVFRNRSSRLEMVMYLLSVVAANGGCGYYRVGGARGAQTR